MSDVKVSVVVPVYNTSKYLRECLDSILCQTLKEIEIICVNDGSTDDSLDILMEYAEKDGRIRIIDKENRGYGHTMNVGFDAAIGEYIGIVESDDLIMSDMLENLYSITRKELVDFVKSDFYMIYGDAQNRIKEKTALIGIKDIYNRRLCKEQINSLYRGNIANWTGIYKKSFIDKYMIRHNETPGASYQDSGFFFQVMMYATSAYVLKDNFYLYRQDNENSSINNKAKVFCNCDENKFIKEIMNKNPKLADEYNAIFQYFKYKVYRYTFTRIADEYRREFLDRIIKEWKAEERLEKLDLGFFMSWDKEEFLTMYRSPEKYYEIKSSFSDKVRSIAKNSKKIIIYGAGVKGTDVYNALKCDFGQFEYICFAVTEIKECQKNKFDKEIKSIYDMASEYKDALVIVAVTKEYENEMAEVARNLGYKRIVLLSEVENYG